MQKPCRTLESIIWISTYLLTFLRTRCTYPHCTDPMYIHRGAQQNLSDEHDDHLRWDLDEGTLGVLSFPTKGGLYGTSETHHADPHYRNMHCPSQHPSLFLTWAHPQAPTSATTYVCTQYERTFIRTYIYVPAWHKNIISGQDVGCQLCDWEPKEFLLFSFQCPLLHARSSHITAITLHLRTPGEQIVHDQKP